MNLENATCENSKCVCDAQFINDNGKCEKGKIDYSLALEVAHAVLCSTQIAQYLMSIFSHKNNIM